MKAILQIYFRTSLRQLSGLKLFCLKNLAFPLTNSKNMAKMAKLFITVFVILSEIFYYTLTSNVPDLPLSRLPRQGPPRPVDITFRPEPRKWSPNSSPTPKPEKDTIHHVSSNDSDFQENTSEEPQRGNCSFKPEPRQGTDYALLLDPLEIGKLNFEQKLFRNRRQASGCQKHFAFINPGQSIRIQSPNYPRDYPNNKRSSICLTSPSGTQMKVACDDFNVENERSCSYDYLGISLDGNLRSIQKFCGRGSLRTPFTSGNKLALVFKSDRSNPGGSSRSPYRFQCTVTVSGTNPETTTAPYTPGDKNCKCGQRNDGSRIVGGMDAKPHSYPWRCYLRTTTHPFFCGCTVISSEWILTAVHCTEAVSPLPRGEKLYVVVGDQDRSTTSEAASQQILVEEIYDHPDYDNQTLDNDISLLRLNRAITPSNTVSPVCLPFRYASDTFANETVTASGWGRTTHGGVSSEVLKEVNLPVLITEECEQYYPGQVTENMICTYKAGKDTCQGDSGGSIDLSRGGRFYAIGVVSWGIGCAQRNNPGVYAKITKYLNFIQKTTDEQFCRP